MIDETYNAASIKILPNSEVIERFGFERIADLERRYPHIATDFLRRMVEACYVSGFEIARAERRYLVGDRSVDVPSEFVEAHNELVRVEFSRKRK